MESQSANDTPRQNTQTLTREHGEHRSVEAALQESQQITAALLDAVPARIFWKDNNLDYLGCNAPFAHDAGFSRPEDIIGKDDYQMGWREQAELHRAADREVVETGHGKLLIDEPQTAPEGKSGSSQTRLKSHACRHTGWSLRLPSWFSYTKATRHWFCCTSSRISASISQ